MDDFPRLRRLDIQPLQHQGKEYFLVRDPLGLAEGDLLAPQEFGPLMSLLDGSTAVQALEEEAQARFGIRYESGLADQLLSALDKGFLLENGAYARRLEKVRRDYREAPHRVSCCENGVYPARAAELKTQLDQWLGVATAAPGASPGVVSPHIDYGRGGPVYAAAWQAVRDSARAAELVIIFGTDHYFGGQPMTLTRQHYATPYGVLPTALPLVDELENLFGEEAAYEGELYHRGEHSVELAAVWLHHIREGKPVQVLPVLTGSACYQDPDGVWGLDQEAAAALRLLRQATEGRQTLVVAAADLSHAGPAFGGLPLSKEDKIRLEEKDRFLMAKIASGDLPGFLEVVEAPGNPTNVCGTYPIAMMMEALGVKGANVLSYDQCPADQAGTSVVSVCAMTSG